jgi:8-oxo-dGTP pyrophosphatase MutT (NUDIX family)
MSARQPAHQIGALPWRRGPDGVLEVLLVTSRETKRWVAPKGWPMVGLSDPEAAATEAWEEAGVKGLIAPAPIGGYSYSKRMKDGEVRLCRVKVYPLEVTADRDDWPEAGQRMRRWLSPLEAAGLVAEPELAALLRAFAPA